MFEVSVRNFWMGSEISKGALKNFATPPKTAVWGGVGRNNEIMTQMSWHGECFQTSGEGKCV